MNQYTEYLSKYPYDEPQNMTKAVKKLNNHLWYPLCQILEDDIAWELRYEIQDQYESV